MRGLTRFVLAIGAFLLSCCGNGESRSESNVHEQDSGCNVANSAIAVSPPIEDGTGRSELVHELLSLPLAISRVLSSGGTFADITPDASIRHYFRDIDVVIESSGGEAVYFYYDDDMPRISTSENLVLQQNKVFLNEEDLLNTLKLQVSDLALVISLSNTARRFPNASLISFESYKLDSRGEPKVEKSWSYLAMMKPANPQAENRSDQGLIVDSISMP